MDVPSYGWNQIPTTTPANRDCSNPMFDQLYHGLELEENFNVFPECLRFSDLLLSHQNMETRLLAFPIGTESVQAQTDHTLHQKGAPYFDEMTMLESRERDSLSRTYGTTAIFDPQQDSTLWAMNQTPMINDRLTNSSSSVNCNQIRSPGAGNNSNTYSPEYPDFLRPQEAVSNLDCDCYEQIMSELSRPGFRTGSSGLSSIDSILACQKELLLHIDTILQCKICSQSEAQANVLMMIIVIIDSLLSTLDATATSPRSSNEEEESPRPVYTEDTNQSKLSTLFKSHIDNCSLYVGGFDVPSEEKACFILQVLQARLSVLLMTIRRIRVYLQQHLAVAFSRGRLLMITETNRKLQLIMMKLNMAID